MIADQRRRTVQAAYDELGPRFGEWGDGIEGDPWERFLDELVWMQEPESEVAFLWALARSRP